jgi:hypothetical protein
MISFKQYLAEEKLPPPPAQQQANPQAPAQQQANPQQTTGPIQNKGFFHNLRAGYQQGQQATQKNQPTFLDQENLEKYRQAAEPAIKTASQIASTMGDTLKKLGISPTFAITLLAAGLTGGGGAVPLAALTYFADKQLNKFAGKAFDKGAAMMGVQTPHHEDYSFHNFLQNKYDEGWRDTAGHMIGNMAGKLVGNTSKLANYLGPKMKQAAGNVLQWANKNKVPIAKALFLTGIGLAVGAGIGKSYKALATPDNLQALGQAVTNTNLVNADDVNKILSNLNVPIISPTQDMTQSITPAKMTSKFVKNLTHTDAATAAASAAQGVSAGLTNVT